MSSVPPPGFQSPPPEPSNDKSKTNSKTKRRVLLAAVGGFLALCVVVSVSVGTQHNGSSPVASAPPSTTSTDNSSTDSSPAPSTVFTSANIDQLAHSADQYKGATVRALAGKVFNVQRDATNTAVQMWTDDKANNQVIVIISDPSFSVKEDDYLRMSGTVYDQFDSQNAMGGDVSVPRLAATEYKVVTASAMHPAVYTASSQTQDLGTVTYTVTKIEFAGNETRVHVKATNNGSRDADVDTDPKVVSNGNQMETTYSGDYPDLSMQLSPGASTRGVLVYSRMSHSGLSIKFESYDADYNDISTTFTY